MRSPYWILLTALDIAMSLGVGASGEAPAADTPKPAANAWMLTPTPYLEWNKGVAPSVRAERDSFWDSSSFRSIPLTSPSSVSPAVGGGLIWDGDPEIRDEPNRAIATATFTSHRSVLSASERSMYTEVTLRVGEVFEDRTGSGGLVPGKDITLLLPGGTVFLRSGKTLSADIPPDEPPLALDHKYLLVLSYDPKGDFYTLADDWDISDGVVRPNTDRTRYLAKKGRSSLSGINVQELGTVLNKELYGAGGGH